MNYLQIEKTSIANGPGVRVVLWVSGCRIHCKGCQNQESWNFNSGKLFNENTKNELFKALSKSYIKGLTISGGHPLEYEHLPYIYDLIKEVRTKFPEKDIWLYTGYSLRISDFDTTIDICWDNGALRNYIIAMCDVVVDGPYIEEQRDITLKFRGSKNQRLIDVKKTLEQGEIVTIQN
jgi:anaerobic ribonucleoside-triphosphate reductase activating protein